MRLRCLFFAFFLWHVAVPRALSSSEVAPPVEPSVDDDGNADMPGSLEKSRTVDYDWTGPYVGANLGYFWGSSGWTAHGGAGPNLTGSLNFCRGFDFSKGTGSFSGGLESGYNYMFPSQFVLGIEGDVSFPNSVRGTHIISSASIGEANYGETMEYAGTVRGRLGYSFNPWLLYGTTGFAWTRDQFTRAQVPSTPLGGSAVAGTAESALRWRTGWAVGAGIEVPFAPHWTGKFEYLFTNFSNTSVAFPAGVQRFDSDMRLHEARLGVNYRFGDESSNANGFTTDLLRFHGQSTFVNQYAPRFREPYRGLNSLISKSGRETWDATLYAGLRLWKGGEAWFNPEFDQGFGLSKTLGVAGFLSGEAYKVGANYPYARLPRFFIRQTIGFGSETENVEPASNQFEISRSANRLVITIGKFAVTDVFDTNKYAHDPRSDFLNWSLIDTGTFDYAADAWGFTYGSALEWYTDRWTVRAGVFDLSIVPNSEQLDPAFRQFQLVFEIERRHNLWGAPGKLALTSYLSRGRMGRYDDAVRLPALTGQPAVVAAVRRYTSRGGISLNVEQQILSELGFFARAGIASGDVEPYEFTDIDRTIAAGLSLSGKFWNRQDDVLAIAGVINDISGSHRRYLNAGGLGILTGDGRLPHPGPEYIVEAYYKIKIWPGVFASSDLQHISNPAYNRDRGPVWIPGFRLHAEF